MLQNHENIPMEHSDISSIYSAILKNNDDVDSIQNILRNCGKTSLQDCLTIEVDRENCKDCIECFERLDTASTDTRHLISKWINQGHCSHWDNNRNDKKTTKCGIKIGHLLAALGNISGLKMLKEKGLPLNSPTCKFKYTSLHIAVMSSQCSTVEFLASEGADVNEKCLYQGDSWVTPVTIASRKGNIDVLKILKDFGANLTKELHRIISTGDAVTIEALIKAGADVNATIDSMHTSPLHVATRRDSKEIIGMLLDNEADILAKDKRGATPIHLAISGCLEKSGMALIDRLAKRHSEWLSKAHLHHDAVRGKSFSLFKKILSVSDLNINEVNSDGNTLLHVASDRDHVEIVKFLISCECELNILNFDFATPLGIAVSKCYLDIVRVLIKAGAEVDNGGIPRKYVKRMYPSLCEITQGSLLFGALCHNSKPLACLLFEAGLNVHKLTWLRSSMKSFTNIDNDLALYITSVLCSPESLQKACRNVIRKYCGQRIYKISNDDITKVMKEYLLIDFI